MIRDTAILYKALNQTRKVDTFNVALAIDWILNQPQISQSTSYMPDLAPIADTSTRQQHNPITINTRQQQQHEMTTSSSSVPMQPPNSPNSNSGNVGGTNANRSLVFEPSKLVDLTDSVPNVSSSQSKLNVGASGTNEDAELEKAIQLSLQEANQRNVGGMHGSSQGPPGMSQEDQDVSRALEASLAEHTGGYGKRRKDGSWADPLNPHDRERNGLWPVGLKNVGQTCWFSAVIQSLFYLPAFRSLVLNYRPPASTITSADKGRDEDEKVSPQESTQSLTSENSRHKKIVEFMLELRKLFALLVASQRKYVDPTRAVDILRASFGGMVNVLENQSRTLSSAGVANSNGPSGDVTGSNGQGVSTTTGGANTNSNIGAASTSTNNVNAQGNNVLIMMDNNQQDVSEFTHIVLEWVEEAFKRPISLLSSPPTTSTSTLENKEELMEEGSVGADGLPHADTGDEKENNEVKQNVDEDEVCLPTKNHFVYSFFMGPLV